MQRSAERVAQYLRFKPQLINRSNRLGQTPLHLAAGWSCGVEKLLDHGAVVDVKDADQRSPLRYAIEAGDLESISLLMQADSYTYQNGDQRYTDEFRTISAFYHSPMRRMPSSFTDVVSEVMIRGLAERRCDLRRRLKMSQVPENEIARILDNDPLLDRNASDAEQALEEYDPGLARKSTLISDLPTVYHSPWLTIEIAEKLWQAGFRDVDVPDKDGVTPLMIDHYNCNLTVGLVNTINLHQWMMEKGADLYRPHHFPDAHENNLAPNKIMLPSSTAFHYLAYHVGVDIHTHGKLWGIAGQYRGQEPVDILNEVLIRFLSRRLAERLCDHCSCACSSEACVATTMIYKGFLQICHPRFPHPEICDARKHLLLLAESVGKILKGSQGPTWLYQEMTRFHTFHAFGLRHTCCSKSCDERTFRILKPGEVAKIRREDSERIKWLEKCCKNSRPVGETRILSSFLKVTG